MAQGLLVASHETRIDADRSLRHRRASDGARVRRVWSTIDPTVWPVLVALSIGQGIGTLSFVLFLVGVARDLGVKRKIRE